MKINLTSKWLAGAIVALFALAATVNAAGYQVFCLKRKGRRPHRHQQRRFQVVATIPVGKRPRGIHASPDGKTVYVALSGTPVEPPPKLDANGNPISEKPGRR